MEPTNISLNTFILIHKNRPKSSNIHQGKNNHMFILDYFKSANTLSKLINN